MDTHVHLWDIVANSYPWLQHPEPGSPPAVLADRFPRYGVDEYRRDVAGWDIVATVHVQAEWDAADPVGETRWLEAVAAATGIPTVIVGAVRLEAPDAPAVMRAHRRSGLVRGVRQLIEREPGDGAELMSDPQWLRGFDALAEIGLLFDLSVYPWQMPAAARLAADHPETPFVLEHAGLPDVVDDDREQWREGLARLAERPNVSVKLSGLTYPRRPVGLVAEYMHEVLERFGPGRAMVGSNLPVEHLGDFSEFTSALDAALSAYSQADRAEILCGTAHRVYDLPVTR